MSNAELDREQDYITLLYTRLDDLRERANDRLAGVLRQSGGTHQARVERETFSAMYRQQLAQFDAAENGLCFGRLEFADGELRYIGRLGIHADTDDYEQLLMDWRADAARPFYLATAASPGDVRVRRHIKTRGRTITSLDDEVLDLAVADPSRHEGLTGESALLAALNASRTGSMGDIVETIQAEQDVIIRAPMAGALVVQGGPGTGKTAVALHRAAYLLYTYRRQLEKRGVLVVGPNATFLRYIGQVLPSLGETSVLLSTIGDLFPGVSATRHEPAEVAAIKGRIGMAKVIAAAVRDRQEVPDEPLRDPRGRRADPARGDGGPGGLPARVRRGLRPAAADPADDRPGTGTGSTLPAAAQPGAVGFRQGDHQRAHPAAGRADRHRRADRRQPDGPPTTWTTCAASCAPTRRSGPPSARSGRSSRRSSWSATCSSDPERLAAAAPRMSAADRAALHRAPDAPWTPADVPLLDEAAELLGEDDRAIRAARGQAPAAGGGLRPGRARHHRPRRRGRPGDPDGRGPRRRQPAGGAVRGRAAT